MNFKARTVAVSLLVLCLGLGLGQEVGARVSWVGTVTECENRDYIGKTIGFVDLDLRNPKYLWPSGHQTESLKAYEDKELLVLVFISELLGSTETVHLEKVNKRFTIVTLATTSVSIAAPGTKPPQLLPTVCRGTLG